MDVTLALASGPASSGLLGTTSLTYQVGPGGGQSRCKGAIWEVCSRAFVVSVGMRTLLRQQLIW